jgi:hypothetical protein
MENKIIGNRNDFSIEYRILDSNGKIPYGECKIWISGRYIGDAGSTIYMHSLQSSLRAALEVKNYNDPLPTTLKGPSELLALMENEVTYDIFRHYFVPIDGFDDFLKLIYCDGGDFVFLTALHPQATSNEEYAQYPKGVHVSRVSFAIFEQAIEDFEKAIQLYEHPYE